MYTTHIPFIGKASFYKTKNINKWKITIKNSMNNKRTYYNWDHLKYFYI